MICYGVKFEIKILYGVRMDTIGDRLKMYREALGLNQSEAAQLFDIPKASYQKYETAFNAPGAEAFEKFLKSGMNIHWLLTGEGNMIASRQGKTVADKVQSLVGRRGRISDNEAIMLSLLSKQKHPPLTLLTGLPVDSKVTASGSPPTEGFVAIPLYDDILASAGNGFIAPEAQSPQRFLMFREDWIKHELSAKASDLCIVKVKGDSMEPLLRAGDSIMIDLRVTQPDSEGIYLLRAGDALLVKSLQILPGTGIQVSSANPAYPSFILNTDNEAEACILGRAVWVGRRL